VAKQPVAQPAAKPAAQQGAQQPLVQQQPEAQISDATKAMFATLMIPDTKPFRPKKPAMEDITAGRGGSDLKYMEKLRKHAVRSFSTFLYKDEVVKLRQPLYASVCPEVDNTLKNSCQWRSMATHIYHGPAGYGPLHLGFDPFRVLRRRG
jgi:hypothetical protein